jgi:hypothetical protein
MVRRVLALRIFLVLLPLALIPFAAGCNGSKCSKNSDCNTDGGYLCLFPAGGGCSSEGQCDKQNSCHETAGPPTVYCTCGGTELALQCVPSNGITDQTTNGACMMPEGGTDAGADGAADGGLDSGSDGGTDQ